MKIIESTQGGVVRVESLRRVVAQFYGTPALMNAKRFIVAHSAIYCCYLLMQGRTEDAKAAARNVIGDLEGKQP